MIRPLTPLLLAMAATLAQTPEAPGGLDGFKGWTTSRLIGAPDPPSPYVLTPAFPGLTFKGPVFLAQDPLSPRLWVAEYDGDIYSFDPADPKGSKELVLHLERGISAFSFHPKYAANGQVFVFSHADNKLPRRQGQMSQVYRFRRDTAAPLPRLLPDSRELIVEWPSGGHNGGEAIIGPDGYLYVSTGDGTSGSDVNKTGQDLSNLFAVMMRLDLDHPDPGRAYGIPPDNPFRDTPGARPEIWAYGYRNPWRFSFDPETGRPWVGDVGQDIWEMIELSKKGDNHGWSVREGTHPFHPNNPKGPTPIVDPVVEHHHSECRSITGGYVYQGTKFPELRGAYLYGDYEYGKMWGLRYNAKAGKVTWHSELLDSAVKISSFGVGRDGSFYALDYNAGTIYQLERRPPATSAAPPFPRKLSQTGLFANVSKQTPQPGVIPYSVNAAFWSDGAIKERYLAMPPGTRITLSEKPEHGARAWEFDDGVVTVKSFALETREGDPSSRRYIETRVILKQDNHWVGYTYAWDANQKDATLVAKGGMDRVYPIRQQDGTTRRQTWHYPSRDECMFCHSRAAGFALGLTTSQMNRTHRYANGVEDNQIHAFNRAGLLKKPLNASPTALPAYPDPFDARADLTQRVRTYLQVNCAMCHVSDGGGNSAMELGYATPLAKAGIVGEAPSHEDLGIAGAKLIKPGAPKESVLWQRITRRARYQMPPVGTNVVDAAGARLMEQWILQLPANAH